MYIVDWASDIVLNYNVMVCHLSCLQHLCHSLITVIRLHSMYILYALRGIHSQIFLGGGGAMAKRASITTRGI